MTQTIPDPLENLRRNPTVTVREAADLLGVSPETAYRWAREGTLPGVIRMGHRTVRIKSSVLLQLLEDPDGMRPSELNN